jgi:hypothetical protein
VNKTAWHLLDYWFPRLPRKREDGALLFGSEGEIVSQSVSHFRE